MKSILIHKLFFFFSRWHPSMWNSPCLLESLDLIIIGFLTHAKPLLTYSLETRLWSHPFIHKSSLELTLILSLYWKPFLSRLLDHQLSHAFLMTSFPKYETMHKRTTCLILNTYACHFDFHTHINKLHLGIRINSSSLIHIPIYMTTIAC